MKKPVLFLASLLLFTSTLTAQVAINTTGDEPDPSAILDLQSTTKGFLVPRVTSAERNLIGTTQSGLLVYDLTTESFWYYDNSQAGWVEIMNGSTLGIDGLADGKADEESVFLGTDAGLADVGNNYNVAIGIDASRDNIGGKRNVAIGNTALSRNYNGSDLVAIGDSALYNNYYSGAYTTYYSNRNTAVGSSSLFTNLQGEDNTAMGYRSLYKNQSASENSAFGSNASRENTSGSYNTSMGMSTMQYNQTGSANTAIGYRAGQGAIGNSINGCVFLGYQAGRFNTSDNKLFIDNSSTSTPLIGGDFSTNQVDINGTIKITGGLPGSGKVLTSDADGVASWEFPDVNYWELSNGNIHNVSSNNVGIGVSAPLAKIHVKNESDLNVINPLAIFEFSGSGNSAGAIRVQNSEGNNYNFGITPNTDNAFEIAYSNNIGMGAGIFRITSAGNVSLVGTIKIEGGSPGSGKVLTSDADGDATWETPTIYASQLNDLSDAIWDGSSIFIGDQVGTVDDGLNYNTALGDEAFKTNTTGMYNTAMGYKTLEFSNGHNNSAFGFKALWQNTSGGYNTAMGRDALINNTTGNNNTAIGKDALNRTSIKSGLTAIGYQSLYYNGTGSTLEAESIENTAVGSQTLFANTLGSQNSAVGMEALKSNTTGSGNSAFGAYSLHSNTTGIQNTSAGVFALTNNTTAEGNTAFGYKASYQISTGNYNASFGLNALYSTTSGTYNSAFSFGALFLNQTGDENTAYGYKALYSNVSGNENTAIGSRAGYKALGSGNVFIGRYAGYNETGSNKLYIDNSSIANPLIYGDFSTNQLEINGTLDVVGAITSTTDIAATNDLTAGGDVVVTGDYSYASAKTKILKIPSAAFSLFTNQDGDKMIHDDNGYWHLDSDDGNGAATIMAPVNLPDGAVVTRFSIFYRNNGEGITVSFRKKDELSISSDMMASYTVSGDHFDVTQFNDITISYSTIDNSSRFYFITAYFYGHATLDFGQLHGAEIEYTITEL
jgi:hypothetical protein